jgi:hypothetical protein
VRSRVAPHGTRGRGRFTSDVPWAEIEGRRARGERAVHLAVEYGISANTIYKRVVRADLPRKRKLCREPVQPQPLELPPLRSCDVCGFRCDADGHPGCISRVSPAVPSFPLYPQKAS